jgi:hypothetical protein
MSALTSIRVLGIHPVESTTKLVRQWVEEQGTDPESHETRDWYLNNVYLIEIQTDPPGAELDFGSFTQKCPELARENWQAAYDERVIDETQGRRAFFLHFVDFAKPLETQLGPIQLPPPTPRPPHLEECEYEFP